MEPPGSDHPSIVEAADAVAKVRPGRRLVAVDGADGVGKTTFADLLAHAVERPTVRASCDHFLNPMSERYIRGRESPEGFYLDSFDYDAFEELLLRPFRAGASFVCHLRDPRTDEAIDEPPRDAAKDAILILDGLFLHRERLRSWWDLSVLLDVPQATAERRYIGREGRARRKRYTVGHSLSLADAEPATRASLILPW